MDERFTLLAATAASNHGFFDIDTARAHGVSDQLRFQWERAGLVQRLGPRTFRFAGCPAEWMQEVAAAVADGGASALAAGRTAAVLNGLDGFAPGPVELWTPRAHRERTPPAVVRSTATPLGRNDITRIRDVRCVTVERLILDAGLFRFTRSEIENAIDSGLRLRKVDEHRLRQRVETDLPTNRRGRRMLLDALVDTGGESRLERRFLQVVRRAGLPRPVLQRVYRTGSRVVARVDAEFPGGLVVEVAGHGTHATRRQRQVDAQRHTELTIRGKRVLTFTFDDVFDRPDWVLATLHRAGVRRAS